MSNKGIYTSLSGAIAQSERLNTISNNIANVNTPGFKKDQQVFREYLTAKEKLPSVILVPKVPASIQSFYDVQGGDRGYVEANGTYTDYSQGGLKSTGNTLDLAIEGSGFYEVLTPNGVRLTRNGSLSIDTSGRLITKGGFPILREGSEEGSTRTIQIKSPNVTITEDGSIFEDSQRIAKLSVVDVKNKDALHKMGSSLYSFKPNLEPLAFKAEDYKIHQGYMETSNVNIVKEMTDMIQASRGFEALQKTIKAYDDIDGQLATVVPELR